MAIHLKFRTDNKFRLYKQNVILNPRYWQGYHDQKAKTRKENDETKQEKNRERHKVFTVLDKTFVDSFTL